MLQPATATRQRTKSTRKLPRLPRWADFVYVVGPEEVDLIGGEFLPRLNRFRIQIGLHAVKDPGRAGGDPLFGPALTEHCERKARVDIHPQRDGIKVRAWGEEVVPDIPEDARSYYVQIYDGARGPCHASVWQRPRVLGTSVRWDKDAEGERDFQRQIRAKVLKGLDPTVMRHVYQEAIQSVLRLHDNAKTQLAVSLRAKREDEAVFGEGGFEKFDLEAAIKRASSTRYVDPYKAKVGKSEG